MGEHPFPGPARVAGEHPFPLVPNHLERVPYIKDIKPSVQKSDPPNLIVEVVGDTPNPGWVFPMLVRRIYVTPPADGIWEYDFLAVRSGSPLTVLEEIRASNFWEDYDEKNVKGVRVYGVDEGVMQRKL